MLSFNRIIIIFFFIISCDFPTLPSLEICNTQFKGGECYLQSMQTESLNIQSFSDNAIIIHYILEDSLTMISDSVFFHIPDSIIIERKSELDSVYTKQIIPYSDTINYYIDSMVYDTGLYQYRLATKNQNGR